MDDDDLLRRAEEALTEIKVATGMSERHAAVLAALRIRLKGTAVATLEEMLDAADDEPAGGLDERLAEADRKPTRSLDDLLRNEPPKPEWPS